MGQSVTLNGSSYTIPDVGEQDWGTDVTNYLVALSTGVLTKAGGTFTLTADVDFGATYGLKANYYKTRSANPASVGSMRFGNNQGVWWRNQANDGDLGLRVDTTDSLEFDGVNVQPLTTRGDIMFRNSSGQNDRLAVGSANQVLKSDGTDISWGAVPGSGAVLLQFGYRVTGTTWGNYSLAPGFYLNNLGTVGSSERDAYAMPRDGSITAYTIRQYVSQIDPGVDDCTNGFTISINETAQITTSVNAFDTASTEEYTWSDTVAAGTYSFSAGDTVGLRIASASDNGSCTKEIVAIVEVTWD